VKGVCGDCSRIVKGNNHVESSATSFQQWTTECRHGDAAPTRQSRSSSSRTKFVTTELESDCKPTLL